MQSGESAVAAWVSALSERLTENGVVLLDSRGAVVASNERARRILGRALGENGSDPLRTIPLEERDGAAIGGEAHPAALALRGVESHDVTVYTERLPGEPTVPVLVDAWPARTEDGTLEGAVVVLRDLSERERAEAFREAFLARAGHELRNPLGALLTATQILHRRAKKRGDPPDRALEIVVESVQNLQKLVEELLDLSRIGRGRLELERGRSPLGSIVVTAAEDARKRFPEAAVEVLIVGDVAHGFWDATRLRQAVRHLVENAVVHGEPPIEVRVVRVSSESVTLCVRDHGPGVPPERREEVLKPFVRRDRNVGMGLGLAVVSEVARAHGGRLWLGEPEDRGPGCAAYLVLPLTP